MITIRLEPYKTLHSKPSYRGFRSP